MIILSLAVAIAVTALIRIVGGLTSRLDISQSVQEYLTCVTYSLLGALTARLIFLPNNNLAETPLEHRLGAAVIAMLVVLVFKWPLWRGLGVGMLSFIVLQSL